MYTHTLLNFKRPPGRHRPRRPECKINPWRVEAPRSHLHFVVQLLEAAVLPRHGELGALQDGLAAGHVAVDLREVHVKPGGPPHKPHTNKQTNSARRRGKEKQTAAPRSWNFSPAELFKKIFQFFYFERLSFRQPRRRSHCVLLINGPDVRQTAWQDRRLGGVLEGLARHYHHIFTSTSAARSTGEKWERGTSILYTKTQFFRTELTTVSATGSCLSCWRWCCSNQKHGKSADIRQWLKREDPVQHLCDSSPFLMHLSGCVGPFARC